MKLEHVTIIKAVTMKIFMPKCAKVLMYLRQIRILLWTTVVAKVKFVPLQMGCTNTDSVIRITLLQEIILQDIGEYYQNLFVIGDISNIIPHISAQRHLSKISFSYFYSPWPPLTLETIKKFMCPQLSHLLLELLLILIKLNLMSWRQK